MSITERNSFGSYHSGGWILFTVIGSPVLKNVRFYVEWTLKTKTILEKPMRVEETKADTIEKSLIILCIHSRVFIFYVLFKTRDTTTIRMFSCFILNTTFGRGRKRFQLFWFEKIRSLGYCYGIFIKKHFLIRPSPRLLPSVVVWRLR